MDLSNMIPNTEINGLTLDEDVRSGMNIVDGTEYKKAFTAVSHATAEVLKNTLGPFGRTTVIDDGSSHYITKDGWNIVNRLGFGQPLYNTLYSFIKDASYNLVEKVGDGTTTVIVAADEFIRQMEQDKDFNSFRNIISEGRMFGVGMVLSTQNLSDFKSAKQEYSQFILSWVILHMNNITKADRYGRAVARRRK